MTKRILFYNDSEIFGGHEIMTSRIINYLQSQGEHEVCCIRYNEEFNLHLNKQVQQISIPFHTKNLLPFVPNHYGLKTRFLREIMLSKVPDIIIISQGFAESGIYGLLAARNIGIKVITYIPFGNTNKELNNRFAIIRDIICKFIFSLPSGFITISPYQARMLSRLTAERQNIHVITNLAKLDHSTPGKQIISLSSGRLNIAVVGRIVFKQKNQNILINVAKELIHYQNNFKIHVIGDGIDKSALERMIKENNLDKKIILHGWMQKDQLNGFISTFVDIILIPSHYEGLPLIMLEAISHSKPFLISDMGFLQDYDIPEKYKVNQKDAKNISEKIIGMINTFDHDEYAEIQKKILTCHSLERFESDVHNTFKELLGEN